MDHTAFKNDWNLIFFLQVAEGALWGYFFIQLGLFLVHIHQLPAYFKASAGEQQTPPPAITYLKRAGIGLVVAGILKIALLLYTSFVMKANFGV